MASTFSTSLKLELIGNGDQSGTWGTTTNTNLGTLLEQAITGVQSIVMSNADYTLTNLNGVSDEARNAVLVVTGTNSAIRNIIAPAVEKLYVIKNNTTGGYAIVIKTSASTGVTIPNGATAAVYFDGTEFYLYVLPSATANTANTLVLRDGSGNFAANVITANTVTQAANDNSTKLASTAYANAAATTAATTAIQLLHPVGSIYTSTVATNPATLFGFGTWVAFGAGRVLVGDGGGFAAGATGGSADAVVVSHTHTATSVVTDPGHFHTITNISSSDSGSGKVSVGGQLTEGVPPNTDSKVTGITVATSTAVPVGSVAGTNQNLQPYIVVYMWNRTA
jgi:hypothetical protein